MGKEFPPKFSTQARNTPADLITEGWRASIRADVLIAIKSGRIARGITP